MSITISADDVEVPAVDVFAPVCSGCGVDLNDDWREHHSILDCLKELKKQIADLRGAK